MRKITDIEKIGLTASDLGFLCCLCLKELGSNGEVHYWRVVLGGIPYCLCSLPCAEHIVERFQKGIPHHDLRVRG